MGFAPVLTHKVSLPWIWVSENASTRQLVNNVLVREVCLHLHELLPLEVTRERNLPVSKA